jgi:hypothetical protein
VPRWSPVPEQLSTLVIVPCGKAKIWDKQPDAGPTPAHHAYTGAPFVVNRTYAQTFGSAWGILSAKYGFLRPDDLIPGPYNVTFKRKATHPIDSGHLRAQVLELGLHRFARVIALGGSEYRRYVFAAFDGSDVDLAFPFAGMALGPSLHAANEAVRRRRAY